MIGVWRNHSAREDTKPDASAGAILCATWERNQLCMVATKSADYPMLGVASAVDPSTLDDKSHIIRVISELTSTVDHSSLPRSFNGDRRLSLPFAEAIATFLSLKVEIEADIRLSVVSKQTFIPPTSEADLPPGHSIVNINLREQSEEWIDRYLRMCNSIRTETLNQPPNAEIPPFIRNSTFAASDRGVFGRIS
jgi:hypothetical protein